MRRLRRVRMLAVVLLAALLMSACAAKWAYRQGEDAAEKGEWDLAVARYTLALEKDPGNIGYKIALESARIQASAFHYEEARKALAAKDLQRAAEELEIASNYDPSNRSAADDLLIVRDRIREAFEEQQRLDDYSQMKAQAEARRVPLPALSPRSPVPITLKFQDASLQKIFDSLARIAGINILFDEGFRDKKYSVSLSGVTFEEALEQLTFVNRLFYKVLDQNTLIVVPESRQKRVAYNDLVLQTFYLQNAEVNDTVNLIKTLAKITTAAGNPSLRAITVMGTVDQVAMAERIINLNDKARGEVIVEVKILEVNKTNMKEWGLDLSNYTAGVTLSPTGTEGETADGFTNIRAHLLSSLNKADWVVTLPSTIFARFLQTDSTVRLLSAPRLRAAEGKKAELKIGTEVPIPVTTFAAASSGVSTFAPATSFQYRNVGVNLVITPEVSGSGDITMEVVAEFSLLGEDRAVSGGGENAQTAPTFLTRNVTNVIRLRDGETGLIGGLVDVAEASSVAGALGVSNIPFIGKLFGKNSKRAEEKEIIISLTPRIVRAPKVTEDDLLAMHVGTQAVPRVKGAGPGLFGPEPEPKRDTPAEVSRPAPAAAPPVTPPAAADPTSSPAGPAPPSPAVPPAPSPAAPPPPEAVPDAVGISAETPARPVNVVFSPPEVALRTGDTGNIAVVMVGAQDLEWVELVLVWDGLLAEITEVKAGSLLTIDGAPVAAARTLEAGRARVRFTRSTGTQGSGAVASVTFRGLREGSGTLLIESVTIGVGGRTEQPSPPPAGRIVVSP